MFAFWVQSGKIVSGMNIAHLLVEPLTLDSRVSLRQFIPYQGRPVIKRKRCEGGACRNVIRIGLEEAHTLLKETRRRSGLELSFYLEVGKEPPRLIKLAGNKNKRLEALIDQFERAVEGMLPSGKLKLSAPAEPPRGLPHVGMGTLLLSRKAVVAPGTSGYVVQTV
jgi:hypothetical protein